MAEAIGLGEKGIICVEKDVEAWVFGWEKDAGEARDVQIFYLSHPSGAANEAWNQKNEEKIKNNKIYQLS